MSRKIALDLDGCGFRFEQKAVDRFGDCDRSQYSFAKRWPNQRKAVNAFVESPLSYLGLPVERGFAKAVADLRAGGHSVHFVTARPASLLMRGVTMIELARHGVRYDGLHLVHYTEKANFILEEGFDLAVDDAPDHINALREMGVYAVVFRQPWNWSVPGPAVDEWDELELKIRLRMMP